MELELPGFRFHPTEEELLDFYLRRTAFGKKLSFEIISTVHLYRHDPWELPGLAKISGEREWYFYVPRDRKLGGGSRPSRITEGGFWKATGCDRPVRSAADPKRLIGLKKTLVYYEGRAPRGTKTDWVMNEYRLPDTSAAASAAESTPLPKEDVVLCKVYRKAASMKELEQRAAAMEEEDLTTSQNSGSVVDSSPEWSDQEFFRPSSPQPPSVDGVIVIDDTKEEEILPPAQPQDSAAPEEITESMAEYSPAWWPEQVDIFEQLNAALTDEVIFVDVDSKRGEGERMAAATEREARGMTRRPASLPELAVPKHTGLEWMQDSFLTQLRSPWTVDNLWSPSLASILNF